MAQAELDQLSIGTESGNSDLEDGDTVIARGWARNMANLKKHGFRPVWTSSNGYPDTDISAFSVEDSIELVPFGAGLMWPIEHLIEQKKFFLSNRR